MSFCHALYSFVKIGCNEYVHGVLKFTQHIICATSYEDTRTFLRRLAYCIALKLEQTLLRQPVVVET